MEWEGISGREKVGEVIRKGLAEPGDSPLEVAWPRRGLVDLLSGKTKYQIQPPAAMLQPTAM